MHSFNHISNHCFLNCSFNSHFFVGQIDHDGADWQFSGQESLTEILGVSNRNMYKYFQNIRGVNNIYHFTNYGHHIYHTRLYQFNGNLFYFFQLKTE